MHLLLVYRLVSVYDLLELSDGGVWPVWGYHCEKPPEPFYDRRYEPHISLKERPEPFVSVEREEGDREEPTSVASSRKRVCIH
jgi:hypothetical protein